MLYRLRRPWAFSLIELLVVVAITGLLGSLALIAFNNSVRATTLSSTAQTATEAIDLARATAAARNLPVEVRFYQIPDANGGEVAFRALQIFLWDRDAPTPMIKPIIFPQSIALSKDPSRSSFLTLVGDDSHSGSASFLQHTNANYVSFRFRGDGMTDLDAARQWHFTLLSVQDQPGGGAETKNYATVSVHALSGQTSIFQPR